MGKRITSKRVPPKRVKSEVPVGEWDFLINMYKLQAGIQDPNLDLSRRVMLSSGTYGMRRKDIAAFADWFQCLADRLHERADIRECMSRAVEPDAYWLASMLEDCRHDLARNTSELRALMSAPVSASERVTIQREVWVRDLAERLDSPAEELRRRAGQARREASKLRSDAGAERRVGRPRNVPLGTLVEWALERGVTATDIQGRLEAAGVGLSREAIQMAMQSERASASARKKGAAEAVAAWEAGRSKKTPRTRE